MSALGLVEQKRGQIESLCRRYGVNRLRLFGSALRSDWDPEASDLDFVAEFGPPPSGTNLFEQQFGLIADLEALFQCPVDVVDWRAAKKPHFRQAVESSAQVLYAA